MDPKTASAAWLESSSGQQTPLAASCVLGRGSSSNVVLPSERASRRHAMVHAQGQDEFWLVDLGSANGTYLNGRRVAQPCRLADKDQITIADSSFVFRQPLALAKAADTATRTEKTIQEIKNLNCWLLVADMERSTQFTKELPTDEAPRITGRWLSDCKQIIDEHGGTINKFLGDGFLAYWPEKESTPALVAKTLAVLVQEQQKEHPRFRVVLHYGKVFAGGASLGEESLLGNEVNFVFRMEKLASSLKALRLMSEPARQRIHARCPVLEKTSCSVPGFDGEFLFFRF
jgi:adenylate cyclase